ncbi:MAG TPA: carboxymuconolactone decarboxylase family protein [Candidatus Altiarchaeales archaeon]|nr:carboxymuconolactone decarboxylase family protein [Candidatus Altiarchaeales archaeon]
MTKMEERLKEAKECVEILGKEYQGLIGPFGVLKRRSVEEDGALPSKTKRLIALALAVATGCEWCIALHTKGALDAGATKDEIIEACFVAVLMGGGPALMYTQLVLKAIEEFKKD